MPILAVLLFLLVVCAVGVVIEYRPSRRVRAWYRKHLARVLHL